jgi:hypothetical protein
MGGAKWLSATLLAGVMAASPALAGSWTFALEDAREAPTLRYVEGGKTTFFMGCGHAFVLHAKYPGQTKKEGLPATITISAGKRTMSFKGEFEEPDEDLATTFAQGDLDYRRQDPDLYTKKWDALRDQLLDLLASGAPLTIAAGKDSYQLPPVDAKDWRKPFEGCG